MEWTALLWFCLSKILGASRCWGLLTCCWALDWTAGCPWGCVECSRRTTLVWRRPPDLSRWTWPRVGRRAGGGGVDCGGCQTPSGSPATAASACWGGRCAATTAAPWRTRGRRPRRPACWPWGRRPSCTAGGWSCPMRVGLFSSPSAVCNKRLEFRFWCAFTSHA